MLNCNRVYLSNCTYFFPSVYLRAVCTLKGLLVAVLLTAQAVPRKEQNPWQNDDFGQCNCITLGLLLAKLCWLRAWIKPHVLWNRAVLAEKTKHHILNIVGVFVSLAVCEGTWEQTDLICFSDLGKFMPCVLNYLKHFQGRASCVAGSVGTVPSPCPPLVIKGMGQTSGTLFCLNTCWWVMCSELLFHT